LWRLSPIFLRFYQHIGKRKKQPPHRMVRRLFF